MRGQVRASTGTQLPGNSSGTVKQVRKLIGPAFLLGSLQALRDAEQPRPWIVGQTLELLGQISDKSPNNTLLAPSLACIQTFRRL